MIATTNENANSIKLKNDLKDSSKPIDIIILKEEKTIKEIPKELKIILPEVKKDYASVIPKIDYKELSFESKESTNADTTIVTPKITFDDNKDIDKIEVKIETKF